MERVEGGERKTRKKKKKERKLVLKNKCGAIDRKGSTGGWMTHPGKKKKKDEMSSLSIIDLQS